jgi:hypothetical protein
MSPIFGTTFHELPEAEQEAVIEQIRTGAEPFTSADGSVVLPGSSLVGVGSA